MIEIDMRNYKSAINENKTYKLHEKKRYSAFCIGKTQKQFSQFVAKNLHENNFFYLNRTLQLNLKSIHFG